jgi:hypothetical protein
MIIAVAVGEEPPLPAALTALSFGERPMQQDLLANGNYAPYLAQALTPPILGAAGMTSGYGAPQGFGPQFGNSGFGQFGQGQFGPGQFGPGQPGQGNNGVLPGGIAVQPGYGYQGPGYGYQGLQPGLGQPLAAPQQLAAQQQQQIAATLHQLAHQAATQAVLGQQIAAVLNQLAHQCAWQAQTTPQNRYGGLGPQAVYGQPFGYGQANGTPFGQAGGFNRLLW